MRCVQNEANISITVIVIVSLYCIYCGYYSAKHIFFRLHPNSGCFLRAMESQMCEWKCDAIDLNSILTITCYYIFKFSISFSSYFSLSPYFSFSDRVSRSLLHECGREKFIQRWELNSRQQLHWFTYSTAHILRYRFYCLSERFNVNLVYLLPSLHKNYVRQHTNEILK